MPQRPPLSQLIIYALGQLGWSLASFGAANLLVYFYMPPETAGETIFPSFIYQGAVLGIATLIGFINFGGRLFDAITDPWIATKSDNRAPQHNKRTFFMKIAALPFALFSFLIFFPPTANIGAINALWLCGTIFLFYLFLTIYVVPYTALISELGHYPPDRMRISTMISISWALGFVIGGMAYQLQAYFEQFTTIVIAFQWVVALYAIIALVFMLAPAFFLKEKDYCYQVQTTTPPIKTSLALIFGNQNFKFFIISDLLYWLALTFIQQGVSYYITALFAWPKEQASTFLAISFISSFALYWPVNQGVKKWGKKTLLVSAFAVFGFIFIIISCLPIIHLPQLFLFYSLAILTAYPLAAFGIVPNAMIADFIYQYEQETQQQQAGLFYAIRNFTMKIGISLALLLFPSFLLLGKSTDSPLGIQLSAAVAAIFCLTGWFIFNKISSPTPPLSS